MFVGEGPGADEDQQGEPFVGRAGQLLTKMIEAMGYRRGDV
jgi:DNA polymerase